MWGSGPSDLERDVGNAQAIREAESRPEEPVFLVGLDLGKSQDPSALVIDERRGKSPTWQHRFRHLQRWRLGTSYPAIIKDVAALIEMIPGERSNITLAVDVTGVGMAVYDFLVQERLPVRLMPILIVAGRAITRDERGVYHVPKVELASVVVAVLGSRRLAIVPMPLTPVLTRELGTFKVKTTVAGNETFEAWREKDHDDIVLASAMALWAGERGNRQAAIFCG